MSEKNDDLEKRVMSLEEAVLRLNREQIKDRVKLIGTLEYIVERIGLSDLNWEDISEIHKEIENSFDEAYEKVKQEIHDEERLKRLIDSAFKKKNS